MPIVEYGLGGHDTNKPKNNVIGIKLQSEDYEKPIPYPDLSKLYYWDEETQNWMLTPFQPL